MEGSPVKHTLFPDDHADLKLATRNAMQQIHTIAIKWERITISNLDQVLTSSYYNIT